MPASARQRCHAVLAGLVTLATAAVVSSPRHAAGAADIWTGPAPTAPTR